MRRLYPLLCFAAGCFRPAPAPGAPCNEALECPGGLQCDRGASPPICVAVLPDAVPDMPGPPAGITWLETVSGSRDDVSFSSLTTDGAIGAAPGDLFIAFVSVKPVHVVNEVKGLGLTWMRLRQQCGGRNTARVALFVATGPAPTSDVVTANLNNGTDFLGAGVLTVHRYRGADPMKPVGNVSFANTNGADGNAICLGGADTLTYKWSTLPTTVANAVVVSGVHTTRYTHDPGPGFTERSDVQSGDQSGTAGMAVQDQLIPDPSPGVEISGSFVGGAPDWAAVALEIQPP